MTEPVGTPDTRTYRSITRQSIEPTYDSRETGPRYHVTSTVDDRSVAFMVKIQDPFVNHTIHIGWRDLLRGLLRRKLTVCVVVGGDKQIVDDVLELDAETLVGGSSRRAEYDAGISKALVRHVKGEEAAAHEAGDLDGLAAHQTLIFH